MIDQNSKPAGHEPASGAAGQGYELRYFARKHGLSTAQAIKLLREIGNDRAKLNEAAVRLRRRASKPGG